MSSYVITGVSKGLGWEFMNQISSNPSNTVIGIVRDKKATGERVAKELDNRSNITILEADITNYAALKKAASDTASITGGKLDYLIANAGYVAPFDGVDNIGDLGDQHDELDKQFHMLMDINVLGNIHLYNLFMPQILKGKGKKVVVISSGHADTDLPNEYSIGQAPLYSASKAAVNMITAKFSAQYKKDGILFLSICPGMVDVGHASNIPPEKMKGLEDMVAKFKMYSPNFAGPATPENAIKDVMSVVERCSIESGHGGAFLSHFGNRQWL